MRQVTHFVLLLLVAWAIMLVTHESGHILGGWLTGATLTDFDLAPWRMPYSLHAPDPHPLVTLWCGPLLGVVMPGLLAMFFRTTTMVFIADFCLLANGLYLLLAWWSGDRHLDTPRLLEAGASPVLVIGLSLIATVVGYYRFRKDCITFWSPSPSIAK